MLQYIRNLVSMHRDRNEAGASAVEYGLLVGAIAAVIVVLVFALGGQVKDMFSTTCNNIEGHTTTQC
jgi:pilus assembly protein Flp/PilA